MISLKQAVAASAVFILMALCSVSANVYVFGVVVDTSDNPVDAASIVISTTGPGGGEILDTLTSGADGAFAKDVVYGEDLSRVRYSASKVGYNSESGMEDVVRDTADLDTIVLRGETVSEIYVFGIIVDTSHNPISDVSIIISGGMMNGTILDTLNSIANGTFAQHIKVAQTYTRVRYTASKSGYRTTTGMGDVVRDTCDLDTIILRDGITSINNAKQINFGINPNNIVLFNLKGQMIYYSSELDIKKLSHNGISLQPVIVQYKLNNTVICKRKIILLK